MSLREKRADSGRHVTTNEGGREGRHVDRGEAGQIKNGTAFVRQMVRRSAQTADVLFKKNIRHGRVSGQDNEPGRDGKAGHNALKQPAHASRKDGHTVSLRGIGEAGHDVRACPFLGIQGTAAGKDGAVPGKSLPGDARRSEINGQHTGLSVP